MTEKDLPNRKEEATFIQMYSKRKLALIESILFHNVHLAVYRSDFF